MEIRIREQEGCAEQPFLLWDSDWVCGPLSAQGGYVDWQVAGPLETSNAGGLKAVAGLHTAVIICLFSNKRAEPWQVPEGSDSQGWWGDTVALRDELFEREIGSLLWTLERGTLDSQTAIAARDMAEDALQVLIEQDAVASIDVQTFAGRKDDMLEIEVALFARDGVKIYDQKFSTLWNQVAVLAGRA